MKHIPNPSGAAPKDPLVRRTKSNVNLGPFHRYAIDRLIENGALPKGRANYGMSSAICDLIEKVASENGITFDEFVSSDNPQKYVTGEKT